MLTTSILTFVISFSTNRVWTSIHFMVNWTTFMSITLMIKTIRALTNIKQQCKAIRLDLHNCLQIIYLGRLTCILQWLLPVMWLSSLIVILIVDWLELLLRASQCLLVSKAREANPWTLSTFQQNEEGKGSNEYSRTTATHIFWIYIQGNIGDLTLDLTWLYLMYEHFILHCFYITLIYFVLIVTLLYNIPQL